jgi:hypothetical protein
MDKKLFIRTRKELNAFRKICELKENLEEIKGL